MSAQESKLQTRNRIQILIFILLSDCTHSRSLLACTHSCLFVIASPSPSLLHSFTFFFFQVSQFLLAARIYILLSSIPSHSISFAFLPLPVLAHAFSVFFPFLPVLARMHSLYVCFSSDISTIEALEAKCAEHKDLIVHVSGSAESTSRELQRTQAEHAGAQKHVRVQDAKLGDALTRLRNAEEQAALLTAQVIDLESAVRVERSRAATSLAEKERDVYQLSDRLKFANEQVAELRRKSDSLERISSDKTRELETALGKAQALNTHLESSRRAQDRQYESRVSDLRERLDYAHSARRSMQNYMGYVQSTYNSVFDPSRA
eukprot:m.659880 g.659880  ORF g.659880 m.659880 type:complete len:319 (+) comp58445_c0_seq1:41-997(+)